MARPGPDHSTGRATDQPWVRWGSRTPRRSTQYSRQNSTQHSTPGGSGSRQGGATPNATGNEAFNATADSFERPNVVGCDFEGLVGPMGKTRALGIISSRPLRPL